MDIEDVTDLSEPTKDVLLRLVEAPLGAMKDADGGVWVATRTGRLLANAVRRERGLPEYPADHAMTEAEVMLLRALKERGWGWASRDAVAEVCGVPPAMARYLMESLDGRGLIDIDARKREVQAQRAATSSPTT